MIILISINWNFAGTYQRPGWEWQVASSAMWSRFVFGDRLASEPFYGQSSPFAQVLFRSLFYQADLMFNAIVRQYIMAFIHIVSIVFQYEYPRAPRVAPLPWVEGTRSPVFSTCWFFGVFDTPAVNVVVTATPAWGSPATDTAAAKAPTRLFPWRNTHSRLRLKENYYVSGYGALLFSLI